MVAGHRRRSWHHHRRRPKSGFASRMSSHCGSERAGRSWPTRCRECGRSRGRSAPSARAPARPRRRNTTPSAGDRAHRPAGGVEGARAVDTPGGACRSAVAAGRWTRGDRSGSRRVRRVHHRRAPHRRRSRHPERRPAAVEHVESELGRRRPSGRFGDRLDAGGVRRAHRTVGRPDGCRAPSGRSAAHRGLVDAGARPGMVRGEVGACACESRCQRHRRCHLDCTRRGPAQGVRPWC